MASIRTATGSLPGYAMQRFGRQHTVDLDGRVFSTRWLIIVLFYLPSFCQSDVIPPVIIEGLATSMIFVPGATVSLPCIATGTSPMTYEWYRNGELLEPGPNSKIILGPDGNLSLRNPVEGFYQCRVRNRAGVAVSRITHLQASVFEEELRRTRKEFVVREAFLPLLRHCYHIRRSVPKAEILWQYDDNENSRIVPSDRVILTDNGSLIFTSLFPNDSSRDNSSFYKCVATNPVTKRGMGGSYFNLKVTGVSSGGQHGSPPHLIYSSDETVHVLEGERFSLWCIFSGVNSSGAFWQLPNRTTLLLPTWKLNFTEAKSSDAGNYSCFVVVGGNLIHKMEKIIRVIVDARPHLEEPLQGQRVQRGETAQFTCRGTGRPPPTVSWLINGTLYNSTAHNGTWYSEFQHQGSYSLHLHDVQSSASIACNVSNKYGHQLSSSYLIVADSVTTTTTTITTTTPSSPSRSTMTSAFKASSSSTGSNQELLEKDGNGSTVSPDNGKSDQEKQNNPDGPSLGVYSIPIVVTVAVVVLISLAIAVFCLLKRRRKNRKYSLKVQDAAVSLKSGEHRRQDGKTWACDSDDSGYDDVSRKPSASLKSKKNLSGNAVMISRL